MQLVPILPIYLLYLLHIEERTHPGGTPFKMAQSTYQHGRHNSKIEKPILILIFRILGKIVVPF
jgi:hypothetical protein